MMKYVGQGAYIHGVPARDLTSSEASKFGKLIEEQEKLTGMKLYEPAKKTAKKEAEKGSK